MSAASDALALALRQALPANSNIESSASRTWACGGAIGDRHRIVLQLPTARAEPFLHGLQEHEFDLPDRIVADITAIAMERSGETVRLTLEALTVGMD